MSKLVPRRPAMATTSAVGEAEATTERARSQGAWEGTRTRGYLRAHREREKERETQRERERQRGGGEVAVVAAGSYSMEASPIV